MKLKTTLFLLAGLLFLSPIYSQETEIKQPPKIPSFVGGIDVLRKYLAVNIKYPKEAMRDKVEGTVVIKFLVKRDGSITNAEVVKSAHRLLDEEALRVVNNMPDWYPGEKNGTPVNVHFSLPIIFQLSN